LGFVILLPLLKAIAYGHDNAPPAGHIEGKQNGTDSRR
jgi:hypothetical protein